jgi:lambda repressor-like predicted transcriptional regulator
MNGMDVLRERIVAELHRRDWSARKASLRAGLSSGALKNFLNPPKAPPKNGRARGISADACRKLATLFEWSEAEVLQLAGHAGRAPEGEGLALISEGLARLPLDAGRQRLYLGIIQDEVRREQARRRGIAVVQSD